MHCCLTLLLVQSALAFNFVGMIYLNRTGPVRDRSKSIPKWRIIPQILVIEPLSFATSA